MSVCDICGMYLLCAAGKLSIKTADHGEACVEVCTPYGLQLGIGAT